MTSIKDFVKIFLIGGLGGIFFIFLLPKLSFLSPLGNVFSFLNSPERVIERVEKEVKIVSQEEAITHQLNKASQSIVLIQSFKGGQLIRFGSGAVLTNDGLILTASNVAPSDSDIFQVFAGNKIFRAKAVKRDFRHNLALLQISEASQSVVTFSSLPLEVGDIGYIVGKYIDVNNVFKFSQQAMVSRKSKDFITLDSRYEADISGSVLINKNGEVSGLVFIDGSKIKAVESGIIKQFFESYSAKINKDEKNSDILLGFSKCLTSLCLVIFETGDDFIKISLKQSVNKLLISFVASQNNSGHNVAQRHDSAQYNHYVAQTAVSQPSDNEVAKRHNIVQHNYYVAQYYDKLINQLDNLINYLETIHHFGKIKKTPLLAALKNLLSFKLVLLDFQKPQENKKMPAKKEESGKKAEINSLSPKIFEFIRQNDALPPDNKAIFGYFSKHSVRTLRRHIKGLLARRAIKRHQRGKIVTYTVSQ